MTDLQPWDTILANYKGKENITFFEISTLQDEVYLKLLEYVDGDHSALYHNGPLTDAARMPIDSRKLFNLQGPSLNYLRSNGWDKEMFDVVIVHGDKAIREAVLDILLSFNLLKTGGLFIVSDVTNFDLLNVFATTMSVTNDPLTNKEANILVYKK